MINIKEKFDNFSQMALKDALILASKDKEKLQPKYVLISLLNQKGSIAAHLLNSIKLQEDHFANGREKIISLTPVISKEAKKIIEKASLIAAIHHHKYIGTEHLLAGILETQDKYVIDLLNKSNINPEILKNKLNSIFEGTTNFPAFYSSGSEEGYDFNEQDRTPLQALKFATKKSSINNFCVDLTNQSVQKDLDPVIGRDQEILRLIQVLARRNKNNPILIGEAGVGKTAIVEGLAKKIASNDVPSILLNKKILSLDVNSLVAGTVFRGEFEARLKNLIAELVQDKNAIVFIDEIHNIIGAGSTSGTLDVANILKPILAKGKIKVIGATTFDEYKKHIEKDPALERRFQPIIVKEPKISQTIKILEGLRTNYETFHNLNISQDAIESAVKLSHRYIQDRLLPDKAIDLLDEAASRYKLENDKKNISHKIKEVENRLMDLKNEKEKNVIEENFDLAVKLKKEESLLLKKIKKLKSLSQDKGKIGQITEKNIYKTISEMINIPQNEITNTDFELDLKNINKKLNKKIIAQTDVIEKIANALKRSLSRISSPQRPLASFLFLGPSGVGKTETAKVLAEILFKNKNSLIRVDMSEFAESFNLSKLIGAPAGYVGFEQGGALTEKIRRNPYSIILFDEIEKAHRAVFNLLLQILEEGTLTDASGRLINFKSAIIVMTSNLGISQLNQKASIGFELSDAKAKKHFHEEFDQLKDELLKEINDFFPPEFLSRIDDILCFNPLNSEDIKKIISLNLTEVVERLKELKVNATFDKKLISYLAKNSTGSKHGARALRKIIRENVEDLLAEKIIDKEVKAGNNIHIAVKNGKVDIKLKNQAS